MSVDATIALISTDDAFAYLGEAQQERDAIWVYYSGANSTATVQVNDTTIVCTDSSAHSLTLASSSYDTLTELVAGINALTDWSAGVIAHGSAASSDLVTTGALNCKAAENEQTLKIRDTHFIDSLIDRASDLINRYCGRVFVSTTYTNEQYLGSGSSRLILDQYPIIRVIRARVGRTNAFSIINTSTDANFCTVEVTSSVLRVIVDGGTNADDTSFTLTDYTDIDSLITAIEALSKGWSCTTIASDTSSRDADEILIRPAMFVDASTSAYVEVGDDELTQYKLIAPSAERNYGVLLKPGCWSPSTEYFVTYVAGWSTIPYALQDACLQLVKYKYEQAQRGSGLKSEKIGSVYAYENFGPADLEHGMTADVKAELDLFRKREF